MNTFGTLFRISIFGESHGAAVGITVDGCPPGTQIPVQAIQRELDRRAPGRSAVATSRAEPDTVKILSGIRDDRATGAPITLMVENTNARSDAYASLARTPRPGHADYPARIKYGGHADMRGSGHFSGRMTAALVMAGAVARCVLHDAGITVAAQTVRIGSVSLRKKIPFDDVVRMAGSNSVRCADADTAARMEAEILAAKKEGDSVGGIVECTVMHAPVGLGEPFFDSVESMLAHLLYAVPAVKGIEFGRGFDVAKLRGSASNDGFCVSGETIGTTSNNAGGILGGLTNGMPVTFRAVFKPTPSIAAPQQTVDYETMRETTLSVKGRHDPCIVPRAVPVVEACAAIAFADLFLRQRAYHEQKQG